MTQMSEPIHTLGLAPSLTGSIERQIAPKSRGGIQHLVRANEFHYGQDRKLQIDTEAIQRQGKIRK